MVLKSAPSSVLLLGGTGTIGRATATALLAAGHQVTALARPEANVAALVGCTITRGDVTQPGLVVRALAEAGSDAIVSCLASRTGTPRDAWAIDHNANRMALQAAQAAAVRQFVLLSAICVQKPLLDFQRAKLAFEAELQASSLTWSIVRPTAFFKSLSGQVARVAGGKPFLVFGDGRLTACKPISDRDLGTFIASCLTDPGLANRILPIGGPGPALTPRDQAAMLFELTGQPPRIKRVPVALMTAIIATLSTLGRVVPALADKASLARIGRYYATESMLLLDPVTGRYDADSTPAFGTDTLRAHYAALLRGDASDERGAHAVF